MFKKLIMAITGTLVFGSIYSMAGESTSRTRVNSDVFGVSEPEQQQLKKASNAESPIQRTFAHEGSEESKVFTSPEKRTRRPSQADFTTQKFTIRVDRRGMQEALSQYFLNKSTALKQENTDQAHLYNGTLIERSRDGSTVSIHMHNGKPNSEDGSRTSLESLKQQMQPIDQVAKYASVLGLEDVRRDLKQSQQSRDRSGNLHYRFQRNFDGVSVKDSIVTAHFDNAGGIKTLVGHNVAPINRALGEFEITKLEAIDIATALFSGNIGFIGHAKMYWRPVLPGVVSPEIEVAVSSSKLKRYIVTIDATSGKIVDVKLDIHEAGQVVAAQGVDLNDEVRAFNVWSEVGVYYLLDPSFPITTSGDQVDPLSGLAPYGDLIILDSQNSESGPFAYVTSGSATSGWDPVGVSAISNTLEVDDYFRTTFGRDGIDNANMNLKSVIHYGVNIGNAFWSAPYLVYGDGDSLFKNLAGCLDVVGHEFGHGVIQSSASLEYEFQSGALNESIADVFGAMVDRNDWLLGDECVLVSPGHLRSMKDPSSGLSSQPVHMDQYKYLPYSTDNGGVHINSGIPNRAVYLLAEGLTDEGLGTSVGRDVAEQLVYHALTKYLVSTSDFGDMRRAMEFAAEDLYPGNSAVSSAVAAAYEAVGIVDSVAGGGGSNTTSLVGTDLMPYLYWNGTDYDLYIQGLPDSGAPYDAANDVFLPTAVEPLGTRPALLANDIYFEVLYIGSDGNIYSYDLNADTEYQLTDTGGYWGVAVDQNGVRAAFTVENAADNNIYTITLADGVVTANPINSSDYTSDDSGIDTLLYADAIAFSPSGRQLIFDALNCFDNAVTLCADGGGDRTWTIGVLDLVYGAVNYPFSFQNTAINIGYPVFSETNENVIAFDLIDSSEFDSSGYQLFTFIYDMASAQQLEGVIRDTGDAFDPVYFWGSPAFRGDDSALIVTQGNVSSASNYAFNLPLNSSYAGDFGSITAVNDFDVNLPSVRRQGLRELVGALSASTTDIQFGEVYLSDQSSNSITFTNNGEVGVTIYSWSLSNSDFGIEISDTEIPAGGSVDIKITYSPSVEEVDNLELTLESNATNESLKVTASGMGVEQKFPGELSIGIPEVSISESGGSFSVDVVRRNGSDNAVSVDYSLTAGTASAGADYVNTSGTLNWADGDADNKTFTIQVLDDSADEPNETFTIELTNPSGGATVSDPSSITATINDDDAAPPPSGGSSSGGGGGGGATVWLLLMLAGILRIRANKIS